MSQGRWHAATRVMIGAAISAAVLGVIGYTTQQPFMFPSVGPTIFIVFFAAMSEQAAPRNVVYAQAIAIVCGFACLLALGLAYAEPSLVNPSGRSLISAAIALTITCFLMIGLGVLHAPAAATTLIVALGLIRTPLHLLMLMLSVVVVLLVAYVINRAYGLRPPVWRPIEQVR